MQFEFRLTIKHSHAGVLYSAEGLSASVSEGEDSKRLVRRRATVNNSTSQGVKGHGFSIQGKILKALLGMDEPAYFYTWLRHLSLISHRHKLRDLCVFLLFVVPTEPQHHSLPVWVNRQCWPGRSSHLHSHLHERNIFPRYMILIQFFICCIQCNDAKVLVSSLFK